MSSKTQIVEELGFQLLPNLLNRALVANDRLKYLLSLLQTAKLHAEDPAAVTVSLKPERLACGLDDESLDSVVQQSSRDPRDGDRILEWPRIQSHLRAELQQMLAPLQAAVDNTGTDAAAGTDSDGFDPVGYQQRMESLTRTFLSRQQDRLPPGLIDSMTSADAARGDSVHLWVMNLHKDLHRLQQRISVESIEGASAYGLEEADRCLVLGFMRGVNRTRPLKFEHPGLDTTATRSAGTLIIQNDIGTTDAHVVVIRVTGRRVSITYSDVHIQRLLFLQGLLSRFDVEWTDTTSKHSSKLNEQLYHLCTGTYLAADAEDLVAYLEHFGSRLVFLIDWNRARKRLRKLAPKRVCLEVLRWAAEHERGHRAFLKLGGEQLVFDALQLSVREPSLIGQPLSDMIGSEEAAEFLKFTFQTATDGLLAGRSEAFIRDQIRAQLRYYLESAHQGLLELAAEHAALIVELAMAARDCLLLAPADPDARMRTAQRAKRWEHRADTLVTDVRNARGQRAESRAAAEVVRVADDAADELEEGIFLLTLLDQCSASGADPLSGPPQEVLQDLANLLVQTSQEYMKAVENARCIHRESSSVEMGDFLEAVDRTTMLEHQADDAHRRGRRCILSFEGDFKQLYLFTAVTDHLEAASDAMMRAALMLRDYILGEVIMP